MLQSLPGHRDAISGLAFRQGTHELYSCAFDRTVKLWSCDDATYVDTLFGHQVTPGEAPLGWPCPAVHCQVRAAALQLSQPHRRRQSQEDCCVQAEVLALDVGRAERAVSGGMDSTCRVWKVPDESQLIFRASSMAVDCCRCAGC